MRFHQLQSTPMIRFYSKSSKVNWSQCSNCKKQSMILSDISLNVNYNTYYTRLSQQIQLLFGTFKKRDKIFNSLKRFHAAVQTVFILNKNIQSFNEHKQFFNYLIQLTETNEVGLSNKYNKIVNDLKSMIIEDTLKERYDKALKAFQYWSFPFYCDYIKMANITLLGNESSNYGKNQSFHLYLNNIQFFLQKINEFEVVYEPKIDNNLHTFKFDNENSIFEWSSKYYPFEVDNLLFILLKGNSSTFFSNENIHSLMSSS
jgi:hypothetical protein